MSQPIKEKESLLHRILSMISYKSVKMKLELLKS